MTDRLRRVNNKNKKNVSHPATSKKWRILATFGGDIQGGCGRDAESFFTSRRRRYTDWQKNSRGHP